VKTLDRTLSRLGVCSRTQARALIAEGRVAVDGRAVRDPERWVDLERQALTLDGRRLGRAKPVYLALHKPKGCVTTLSDPEGRSTVYDLLRGVPDWVFPIGRLDRDTSGLLLFTNDSAFAEGIAAPEARVPKVYRVRTRAPLSDDELEPLRRGVLLHDGLARPARATLLRAYKGYSLVELELTEGRNREVRRMLSALGNGVRELRRVSIGPLALGTLASGAWRRLTPAEVAGLRNAGRAPAARPRRPARGGRRPPA
jgi:23S rRNA pseudouridine2605 synthase